MTKHNTQQGNPIYLKPTTLAEFSIRCLIPIETVVTTYWTLLLAGRHGKVDWIDKHLSDNLIAVDSLFSSLA